MMNPPPGSITCVKCSGRGRGTTYYGMAGDHDGVEWVCSTCNGKGHVKAPAVPSEPGSPSGLPSPTPSAPDGLSGPLRATDGQTFGTLPGGQRYTVAPNPKPPPEVVYIPRDIQIDDVGNLPTLTFVHPFEADSPPIKIILSPEAATMIGQALLLHGDLFARWEKATKALVAEHERETLAVIERYKESIRLL